jgi:hypothetical protein
MEIAYERKLKVVPILPKIAAFFRKSKNFNPRNTYQINQLIKGA